MNSAQKYNNVRNIVNDEMLIVEKLLAFNLDNLIKKAIAEIVFAPSKRLRPLVSLLLLKCENETITDEQYSIIASVEIIHTSSLIHDDIIDNADLRRNTKTLNSKFSDKIAVVAGDFLFAVAIEMLQNVLSKDIVKTFSATMQAMCDGEMAQYLSKGVIPTLNDYLQKTKNKTAKLFECGIKSCIFAQSAYDNAFMHACSEFAINFGIAFQIRDDLLNIIAKRDLKPIKNDSEQGIYTAPYIFEQMNKDVSGIAKTKELMDNYFIKAVSALKYFKESKYKSALEELVELLRDV